MPEEQGLGHHHRLEPYSIAIALLDAGVPTARFRIDAVDVSARALARAPWRVRRQRLPQWPAGFP
ncbi:putative methyltransferase (plasmid) [Cupriavidus necator H16]|uniref:Putative methyltransferase n=1 Tax=Cupriavidus necator (strain ATCC 17699 / DSM 428 / KCTC 22496 / NCIMB 10442 / H16 / Stanier 337) TaxID=381666 RepID=Q7WXK6_CUPNH|nr:putative methyltransferase [Cupriavidus necator H16]